MQRSTGDLYFFSVWCLVMIVYVLLETVCSSVETELFCPVWIIQFSQWEINANIQSWLIPVMLLPRQWIKGCSPLHHSGFLNRVATTVFVSMPITSPYFVNYWISLCFITTVLSDPTSTEVNQFALLPWRTTTPFFWHTLFWRHSPYSFRLAN